MSAKLGEFDIIRRFFRREGAGAVVGIGDDGAVLAPRPGMELVAAADMLVSGRHFFPHVGPGSLGHKSLAVNLSDLAAMGAEPRWALLTIALPSADVDWLEGFAGGFFGLARRHGVGLVGGDTTRGPLTVSVTVLGEVPAGQALCRHGGAAGDDLWVSGTIGGAAAALAHLENRLQLEPMAAAGCLPCLHVPRPRVGLGQALRGIASAAIDISDGLLADLGHLSAASGVGAEVWFGELPAHPALLPHLGQAAAMECLVAGGDDYELLFAAPADCRDRLAFMAAELEVPLARIGRLTPQAGVCLRDADGAEMEVTRLGYDHFS